MGVMFSTVPYDIFNPTPMTNNATLYTNSIINDTVNWTMIFGSFIADSAYNYIILGNFFDNNHTDTLMITTGFFNASYYYLDDICVSTDSLFTATYNWTNNSETIKEVIPQSTPTI